MNVREMVGFYRQVAAAHADSVTDVERQPGPAFMDTRFFDMTMPDGRIYRVRVSDITPEKETAS